MCIIPPPLSLSLLGGGWVGGGGGDLFPTPLDKIGFFFLGERFTVFASVTESRPLEKSGVRLSVKLEYKTSGVREEG